MSTKKISVNPAFFKLNGSKTLKRRERKEKREKKELAKRENKELKMKLMDLFLLEIIVNMKKTKSLQN